MTMFDMDRYMPGPTERSSAPAVRITFDLRLDDARVDSAWARSRRKTVKRLESMVCERFHFVGRVENFKAKDTRDIKESER